MRALIKLHSYYLFHLKTQRMLWLLLLMIIGMFVITSGLFSNRQLFLDYKTFWFEYRIESVGFMKLSSLCLIFYMVIQLYFYKTYDTMLLQLKSKTSIYLSKTILMVLTMSLFWLTSTLFFGVIGRLSGFNIGGNALVQYWIKGTLFSMFYIVFFSLVTHMINHILGLFMPFIGWFLIELMHNPMQNNGNFGVLDKIFRLFFFSFFASYDALFTIEINLIYVLFIMLLMIGITLLIMNKKTL